MRKSITTEEVKCDICHTDMTDYQQFAIKFAGAGEWDICEHCKDKLQIILTFLTITVGIDITYKWTKL